jgi:uncharacterized protein YqkB
MAVKITFTEKAIEKLKPILSRTKKQLKLKYDTDDCGCAVNGITALWLVGEADHDDVVVETNFVPILLEKPRLVFYDETMTIDTVESAGCFQLKSPSQIINPRMSLVERSEDNE